MPFLGTRMMIITVAMLPTATHKAQPEKIMCVYNVIQTRFSCQ